MNEYDSKRILDLTKKINYLPTNNLDEANCYILNTCHIREKATEKVYHDIGRIKKKFKNKTKPIVIVAGCVAQAENEILLEKERIYNLERQKIEFALESFYRSAHSLCFQINKRYIPKYLSILRLIDRRFETSEIFIKWDEAPDEEWLLLIYIKNNSPEEGIVIEDKSNPEKNISHEFKANEIFKASDLMVDSLTQLISRIRAKKD